MMESQFRRIAFASVLSLCFAAGVACAQDNKSNTTTTTQTTTTTTITASNDTDINFLTNPGVSRIYALQEINDMGLSTEDMIRILPLLQDLRDARSGFRVGTQVTENDLLMTSPGNGDKRTTVHVSGSDVTGPDRVSDLERGYNDHVSKIWQTISDKVGAAKADRLHALVDPPMADMSQQTAYWNGIRRIDQLLVRWDAESARRLAMQNGGTNSGNTTQQTTVETTIEPSPVVPIDQTPTLTTHPYVPVSTLVDIISDKLIAMNSDPYSSLTLNPRVDDLKSTDFTYLRNHRLYMWK